MGRSIVIRRRARRTIEEAIRNGTWIPQAGRQVVKLGDKPKLFNVYTTVDGILCRSPLDSNFLPWGNLKVHPPFFVSLRYDKCMSVHRPCMGHHTAAFCDVGNTGIFTSSSSGGTTPCVNRAPSFAPFSFSSPAPSNTSGCYPRITHPPTYDSPTTTQHNAYGFRYDCHAHSSHYRTSQPLRGHISARPVWGCPPSNTAQLDNGRETRVRLRPSCIFVSLLVPFYVHHT